MEEVKIVSDEGVMCLMAGDDTLMCNSPEAISDQKEMAAQAFGDVLVAGYGFGFLQKFLTESPKVNSVTSVEILPEVIDLARKEFGKIYGTAVVGDFFGYTPPQGRKFDCVMGDIWVAHQFSSSDLLKFKEKANSLLKEGGKIITFFNDESTSGETNVTEDTFSRILDRLISG